MKIVGSVVYLVVADPKCEDRNAKASLPVLFNGCAAIRLGGWEQQRQRDLHVALQLVHLGSQVLLESYPELCGEGASCAEHGHFPFESVALLALDSQFAAILIAQA